MNKEDEAELFTFFQENLDEYKRFHRYWDWRQKSQPVSKGENAVLAHHNSHGLIGCIGIVPVELRYSDKTIKTSWQQDSLVSPSARGMGIGKKLIIQGGKGWELTLAKGTSSPMYGLRKKLGYQDVPNSNYLIRVCNSWKTQGSLIKKILFHMLRLLNVLLIQPVQKQKIDIRQIDSFDNSFDDLADSLSSENTLRPRKGKDYLNWRYCMCPDKRYIIFKVGIEKARGAIIINCIGPESDEGWIVDMICKSKDKGCAYALIQTAILYFKKKQVSRIWCFATHPAARKWFFRFGFIPTNKSPRFTYSVRNNDVKYNLSLCDWDFWHGDGDIELYQ